MRDNNVNCCGRQVNSNRVAAYMFSAASLVASGTAVLAYAALDSYPASGGWKILSVCVSMFASIGSLVGAASYYNKAKDEERMAAISQGVVVDNRFYQQGYVLANQSENPAMYQQPVDGDVNNFGQVVSVYDAPQPVNYGQLVPIVREQIGHVAAQQLRRSASAPQLGCIL